MKIALRLFGVYREGLDAREIVLELADGATVADAEAAFSARWERRECSDSPNEPTPTFKPVVLVNGRNAETLAEEERILSEGDRLVITPPLGGG